MNGRITFRKGKLKDGQMRLPATYKAIRDGKEIAQIQGVASEGFDSLLWFWYGDGVNTCRQPLGLEECKAAIIKHFSP